VSGRFVVSLSKQQQTRRQIARALQAIGVEVEFVKTAPEIWQCIDRRAPPSLIIFDCDEDEAQFEGLLAGLAGSGGSGGSVPVILLSTTWDKTPLLELVRRYDMGGLVAKHMALRAAHPMLDERELSVTCEKVLRREIFGIDKYIGAFGVIKHRATIDSIASKASFLAQFEQYIAGLECPSAVVPEIVTVADELILNAVIHAPRLPDGTPKYEAEGATAGLVLEPHEHIEIAYGCDGRYVMVSVSDNFGRLERSTLYNYLSRRFQGQQVAVEHKPSGAGLGLSFAARSIHQLVFNIHDTVRTEVIAGWYLRVQNAREFAQVEKSLNVFRLPAPE
jgi:CheY-like chemotaxis protein